MIKGPLEADARIAAKNAVKIRAALGLVTDWKRTYERYQETHPIATDNKAQDRARARAWVMLNVGLVIDPLANAINRSWAEAWVLGTEAGKEWIRKARKAKKAGQADINWATWKPGDKATALMLKPIGGYEKFLQQHGGANFFRNFNRETIENLGTAMANSIEAGLSAEEAALMIKNYVANASRALTIAITEQNRAMSAATIESFRQNDIERMEWATSSPCDLCAENEGVIRSIGQAFPSDDLQPPAHPHCRCVLIPVIPGMDGEADAVDGATLVDMPSGSAHTGSEPEPSPVPNVAEVDDPSVHRVGRWSEVPRSQVRSELVTQYLKANPQYTPEKIEMFIDAGRIPKSDQSLLKKGVVYQNGDVRVQFYSTGSSLKPEIRQGVLDYVDKLQTSNPVPNLIVSIGSESSSKHGWATLGGNQMWITPKTARTLTPNPSEANGFKMPSLLEASQRDYTLAHEWGHLIDRGGSTRLGVQAKDTTLTIEKLKKTYADAFQSKYSGKNTKEFYAEMFAEFYTTNGATDNALVQAMAKEFNWQK